MRFQEQMQMQTSKIRNSRTEPIRFWLEPWAEEFEIPPGSTLKLQFESAGAVTIYPEVEITEALTVWWFGSCCRVKVYIDGADVTGNSWNIPSPNL